MYCSFASIWQADLLLLLLLFTAVELSLGGSSSYTSTDKTNNSKYILSKCRKYGALTPLLHAPLCRSQVYLSHAKYN